MSLGLGGGTDHHGISYAQAALDRECETVAATQHGRNEQLNRSAYSLGQLVGAGLLDRDEVMHRLLRVAEANGYVGKDGPSAARATIASGLEHGTRQPREVPEARKGTRSGRNGSGAPHQTPTAAATVTKAAAPRLSGVPLPFSTPPNDKGVPAFEAVGQDQPPPIPGEMPDRRHAYRRDGEAVRYKIKKASGAAFIDYYRVRRPDTGEVGWQCRKPAGFVPVPYLGAANAFDADLAGDVLFWTEGEKDVDTLVRHGLAAFTFGGTSDVPDGCEALLAGRDLVILADNDQPGRRSAEKKAAKYVEVAQRVRWLAFDELAVGGDVSDFLALGNGVDALWARVDAARVVSRAKPLISATPFRWIEPRSIPPRAWLYGWHYIRKFLSCTISPGGVGKSSLAIVEAIAIITRKDLLGIKPAEQVNVWYWNGEDPQEELDRRVMAAAMHYRLEPEDLEGRLFVDSGRVQPLIVARQTRDGVVVAVPVVDAVKQTIRDRKIGLVIIDPFISSHQVTENDNNAIEVVATTWAHIADETGCAVELVHHARKTGGAEVTVEDGRGAVALLSKARCARALNGMTKEEADEAGVENRRVHFRCYDGKANLAPPSDVSTWLKLASIDLGNARADRPSDSVGVAVSWQWPDPLKSVDLTDLRAIQQTVSQGEFRASSQAADWVGKVVASQLRLDAGNRSHRSRIAKMLAIWIRNSMFKIVKRPDRNRHDREYVEVDQWA